MIRVFIGYDPRESVAFHVLAHSILRRASVPVSVTPVALSQLTAIFARDRDPLQSTDFSFSRFLVPALCDFAGWAIFMDCDMLVLGDIARLWDLRDDSYAVQVVKHDHRPREATKFLGAIQTTYPRKNWSSVMLMNCDLCSRLSPEYVATASGRELHGFKWIHPEDNVSDLMIGALPAAWNHLVGYDTPQGDELNLHFTHGGPWFPAYANGGFADLWRRERNAAFGVR